MLADRCVIFRAESSHCVRSFFPFVACEGAVSRVAAEVAVMGGFSFAFPVVVDYGKLEHLAVVGAGVSEVKPC